MSREISFRHLPLILAGCVALAGLAAFLEHAPSAQDQPRESTVCLDCHGGLDSTLAGTAHWSGKTHDGAGALVACTDCHVGDRRHWEDDAEKFPMSNPARLDAASQAAACSRCHQNSHQQNMAERNVHAANEVSCSGCHRMHGAKKGAKNASLLAKPEPELCVGCHQRTEGQFARSYRHPVAEGVVKCTDCHTTLDRTSKALTYNGTSVCLDCHGEFAGPFPFQHQATMDHSTDEGGCLSCHEPHGSHLPRMMKQPYEPPHYPLCSQCHSVPRHFSNSMHGTAWAAMACNDCHTDIHGSYDNRLFVNESLKAQGCFNSGCHRN